LQLMVRALQAGVPVLVWVIMLVGPAVACAALGMNYTLVDFIQDESQELKHRVDCYNYFGTFSKAMLSMFEVTFASWVPICRFLHGRVDERVALFIMGWKLVVGVAVLRVVYGVFLHVTFRCVHANEELLIAQKLREDRKYRARIFDIFTRFDVTGSGGLSWEEFRRIANDERINALLCAMDLDIKDAELVFLLANPDGGEMTPDEMMDGFSKLKGFARAVDVGSVLHEQRKSIENQAIISEQLAKTLGKIEKSMKRS